jgi:hypothetical protein
MQDRNAARNMAFKRGRAEEWTAERIAKLSKVEIQQLRDNATRLGETALTTLCTEALKPAKVKAADRKKAKAAAKAA